MTASSSTVHRPYSDNDSSPSEATSSALKNFYNRRSHSIPRSRVRGRIPQISPVVEEVYDLNSEYGGLDTADSNSDFGDIGQTTSSSTEASSEASSAFSFLSFSGPLVAFRRRRPESDNSHQNGHNLAKKETGATEANASKGSSPESTNSPSSHSTWNKLNAALFVGQALLSAATSVPVTLVPTMAQSLAGNAEDESNYSSYRSSFSGYSNPTGYSSNGLDSSGGDMSVDSSGATSMEETTTTLEVYDESGTRKRWIPFRVRTRKGNLATSDNNYVNTNGFSNTNNQSISSSSFASHLTAIVTLATACGKFLNGPLVDLTGARRLLVLYSMGTSLALLGLRYIGTPKGAIWCCAAVEFFSSVLWPCGMVILGAHYGMAGNDAKSVQTPGKQANNGAVIRGINTGQTPDQDSSSKPEGRFERGIYVISLASRCGSLLAMPLSSLALKWTNLTWRDIAGLAALAALGGVIVFYYCLTDSPGKLHDPQNPIQTHPMKKSGGKFHTYKPWSPHQSSRLYRTFSFCSAAFSTVFPSLRTVIVSRVFWAVAAAHAGATMVKSSERILGSYYRDTSFGVVAESKAGAMTVFLSVGMLGGLLIGGRAFALAAEGDRERRQGRNSSLPSKNSTAKPDWQEELTRIDASQLRPKNMIAFFYCLSICMCYVLSFLAMPFIRRALHVPFLVLILQVFATLGLGAGVAVQYYHIPAVVGATYGKNRGLYTAYTDGVASLVSSMVWRVVGGAVEEGNPQGCGWAYGWAAVALLLVFCGTLMVGIMEIYFVGGGWRHHDGKKEDNEGIKPYPDELPSQDMSGSWMEDEILSTGFSVEDSSHRRHGGIRDLSSSALQFISPRRTRRDLHSNLTTIQSHEDEEAKNKEKVDLLGIDDDGSLLFPVAESTSGQDLDTIVESLNFMPLSNNTDDLKNRVLRQLELDENQLCCDCSAEFPRWASILAQVRKTGPMLPTAIGCFCCTECAGAHRNLGTHIAFVRSVDHDKFAEREVLALENGGNEKVNRLYERTMTESDMAQFRPTKNADGWKRGKFVMMKYEKHHWYVSDNDLVQGEGTLASEKSECSTDAFKDGDLGFLSQPISPAKASSGKSTINTITGHTEAIELTLASQNLPIEFNDGRVVTTSRPSDTRSGTEISAGYVSFDRMFGSSNTNRVHAASVDDEFSVREGTTFDDQPSIMANTLSNNDDSGPKHSNFRDLATPPPVDTFFL